MAITTIRGVLESSWALWDHNLLEMAWVFGLETDEIRVSLATSPLVRDALMFLLHPMFRSRTIESTLWVSKNTEMKRIDRWVTRNPLPKIYERNLELEAHREAWSLTPAVAYARVRACVNSHHRFAHFSGSPKFAIVRAKSRGCGVCKWTLFAFFFLASFFLIFAVGWLIYIDSCGELR